MASSTSEWRNAVLKAIAQFLELPDPPEAEWRVRRPTPKAYKVAVDLISDFPQKRLASLPLPRVAPDRQGGIEFEWEKGRYALEIAVMPNGAIELLKATPKNEDEEGRCSLERARDTILWFARV